jgi:protein-L-isoaspartate(D-aspartate) O-methyltransferase
MISEQLVSRGIDDPRVLSAMSRVPRHLFVDEAFQSRAYQDSPLPIGQQQTISQPFMVALMSQSLRLTGSETVLEIGTGSGYQTAVLAELARLVFTVERLPALSARAGETLHALGYRNVVLRIGDGTLGWGQMAPFEAILVTAGSPSVPQPLKEQLALGGRMVIPVGEKRAQQLLRVTRQSQTLFLTETLAGCVFVDLVGEHGWNQG